MKRPISCCLLTLAGFLAATVFAGPRTSSSYSIQTESFDSGGQRTGSVNYTHDGVLGGSAAVAIGGANPYVNKSGYAGQLTDVVGVLLSAPSNTVAEGGTLQFTAAQGLDDDTTVALTPTSVTWSVSAGPVSSVSTSGLLVAGLVYQNTPATVRGDFGGFSGAFNLQVLDTLPDNFGAYANDGIADAWQVQYFGLNNPNAAPSVDFSGTGQSNLFKFVAGLNPLDPTSRFVVDAAPVVGQPSQRLISFGPAVGGRLYLVRASGDLTSATWNIVSGNIQIVGGQGTILDTAAAGTKRFYEVQIIKP